MAAKTRQIQTKFWSDPYIQELSHEEKLLFLYLFTNEHTNISGVYEITIQTIANETCLEKERIKKVLDKFSDDKKIYYNTNYIVLVNFIKNQTLNPSVVKGINRELANLPQEINKLLQTVTAWVQPGDSVGQPGTLNLTKLNLTKPNGFFLEEEKQGTKKKPLIANL
jgi:hypothetical protein